MKWYVIQVNESMEIGVRRGLVHVGATPLRLTRFERGRNGSPPSLRPLFPGYFFIQLDLTRPIWAHALEVPGVFGYLVDERGWPQPIEDGVIEEIRERFKIVDPTTLAIRPGIALRPIQVGETVRITSGPFAAFHAVLEHADETTVSVIVEIFGRPSKANLTPHQIERL